MDSRQHETYMRMWLAASFIAAVLWIGFEALFQKSLFKDPAVRVWSFLLIVSVPLLLGSWHWFGSVRAKERGQFGRPYSPKELRVATLIAYGCLAGGCIAIFLRVFVFGTPR
jgi:hypothetical protein